MLPTMANVPDESQPDADAETPAHEAWLDLGPYTVGGYTPGRNKLVQIAWYFASLLLIESGWFPPSAPKVWLLRLFGARIGRGVRIKPHVRIKFPWRLEIGDHTWIGQQVWIDNLARVTIGSNVCISQDVYFCTGSHDHRKRSFDLAERPIAVGDGAWVAARATLLAGVSVGPNALVAAGAVVHDDVPAAKIVAGMPAKVLADRPRPVD